LPPPLCGIPDADTVRSLYDYTLWLDSLPDYGLLGYNAVLRQILVNTKADPINHVPGRLVLFTSLYDFEKKLFERQGWQGLPGSVPPLSPQDEKALLTPLLKGLSTRFRMNIDTLPNLSRDNTIFPTGPLTVEEDMAALFIGSSNADRLANSAATLGIATETITTAGWVLSTDAVTAILPQVTELCGSLPAGAPVVIYCLDNSSFCCANSEGQLSAFTKQKDGLYHVPVEIVVVHKVTLAAAVTNLKRLLVACTDRMVIIITPGPRYHSIPCCCSGDHCTHLQIPESGIKLMQDLARLHLFIISRRLSSSANCSVLPACDLLTGKRNASPEEALAVFSSWGPCTAPAPTTRGWPSIWLTTTSARRLPRRCRPLSSLSPRCGPRDHGLTHLPHTSPGWSPVGQFRHSPASGPLIVSRRPSTASRPYPASPGAAPEAANGGGGPPSSKRGSGSGQGTAGRTGRTGP
jgi:hypothetical protein